MAESQTELEAALATVRARCADLRENWVHEHLHGNIGRFYPQHEAVIESLEALADAVEAVALRKTVRHG